MATVVHVDSSEQVTYKHRQVQQTRAGPVRGIHDEHLLNAAGRTSDDINWLRSAPQGTRLHTATSETSIVAPRGRQAVETSRGTRLTSCEEPVVRRLSDGRQSLHIEVVIPSGFTPHDIHINTEGNILQVRATSHHAHADKKSSSRNKTWTSSTVDRQQFKRQFQLNDVVRAENIKCFLRNDGVLTIDGVLGRDIVGDSKRKVRFAI